MFQVKPNREQEAAGNGGGKAYSRERVKNSMPLLPTVPPTAVSFQVSGEELHTSR